MESSEGTSQRSNTINNFFSNVIEKAKLRERLTWNLLKTLLLGQGLSMLLCGTAISSQYLAGEFAVNTPVLQSFINYLLLFMVYTGVLAFRQGNGNLVQILKAKWWKYLLLGFIDVEANYMVVKAYQYTTLTSVQLLDCFVIPVVMLLSRFTLHSRYKAIHFVAVLMCLLGVGIMVCADVLGAKHQGVGINMLVGDLLVLGGATLYGISNVSEEFIVKNFSREEFLGMLGLFATLFSGIQLGILEHNDIANINWNWQVVLLFTSFAVCMFGWYSFLPVVIKLSNATSVNLAILTADLYSLFFGIFLFHYKEDVGVAEGNIHSHQLFKAVLSILLTAFFHPLFSALYILAFVIIMVGFILYNLTPSHTTQLQCQQQAASQGSTNPVPVNDDNTQEESSHSPAGDFSAETPNQNSCSTFYNFH